MYPHVSWWPIVWTTKDSVYHHHNKKWFTYTEKSAFSIFSSSETQGQSAVSGEKAGRKFLSTGKRTDSRLTISKNSRGCRLLIGHKKCFVLLCPIGKQFPLSSFREFVHDGYSLDHGLSGSCTKNIHAVRKLSVWYKIPMSFQNTVCPKSKNTSLGL